MAIAVLAAVHHRERTGEGQWVDLASTSAGLAMLGTEILDWTVNGRTTRRPGRPAGNRADFAEMAPHGIYPAAGDDRWVAIACRDDRDWDALAEVVGEPWARDERYATLAARLTDHDALDVRLSAFTAGHDAGELAGRLVAAGVPASVVKSPAERIDDDPDVAAWGLFPEVHHPQIGTARVEGLPLHLSETDWAITEPAPCLGEHNDLVFSGLLGRSAGEVDRLREEGVI
jgi:crotonobetainyl-CoA:carnitine CoA-transferase CaiB-like acyl-CoA transferase